VLTVQVTVMEELELPTDAVASTLVGGKGAGEEWCVDGGDVGGEEWYVGVRGEGWCVDMGGEWGCWRGRDSVWVSGRNSMRYDYCKQSSYQARYLHLPVRNLLHDSLVVQLCSYTIHVYTFYTRYYLYVASA